SAAWRPSSGARCTRRMRLRDPVSTRPVETCRAPASRSEAPAGPASETASGDRLIAYGLLALAKHVRYMPRRAYSDGDRCWMTRSPSRNGQEEPLDSCDTCIYNEVEHQGATRSWTTPRPPSTPSPRPASPCAYAC